MARILLCHDDIDFAKTRGETLTRIYGHEVVVCTTARISLETVNLGINSFDVAIIHKDLGLGIETIDSDRVVGAIHDLDPFIRVGITSGEFPDGERHVVNVLRADFYMDTTTDIKWLLYQINRGLVPLEEMKKRGTSVEMPPHASSRERLFR